MSPGTGRCYPLTMVCEVWRVAGSTVYTARDRTAAPELTRPRKRGPKTAMSDEALLEEIRVVLKDTRRIRWMSSERGKTGIHLPLPALIREAAERWARG